MQKASGAGGAGSNCLEGVPDDFCSTITYNLLVMARQEL